MNYIIHYDIAALIIIFTIMIHFFFKKNILTFQNKLFSILMIFAFVSTALDLISLTTIYYVDYLPISINYLVNCLYLISFNYVPVVYLCYIMSMSFDFHRFTPVTQLMIFLPACLSIILIILTPFNGCVFSFNEGNEYMHGNGFYVLCANALLYILVSLVFTLKNRKLLTFSQRVSVYFYTIASFMVVIFQLFFPSLLLTSFVIALSLLLIYLSLQNPEDYSDKLLGTFNRSAFVHYVENYIGHGKRFTIIGVQIDGFKHINETIGVSNGDLLLKSIAEFLLDITPEGKVFHISGVQFALVLDYGEENGASLTDSIRKRFEQSFVTNGISVSLSAPMCCLSYPDNVKSLTDIIDMIEYSLKESRSTANKCVVYASDEILEKKHRERKIEKAMKNAILHNDFKVYYQPIYSAKLKRFATAEALIRLYDNELGFISPEEFITMAEKSGDILKIGDFVFRRVCMFIVENKLWQKGIEYVEVNLSVVQCMQEQLHEHLIKIMDAYGLKYSMINLEITETAAIVSHDTLIDNMNNLIKRGIMFSLDDYGTGFSNTANIIQYPFKLIKLDKSIVWSAMENKKAMIALKHTIYMLKSMNLEIVAEGVETLEQADMLMEFGVDFLQGYYYSKPIPEKDFLSCISKQHISTNSIA